MTSRHVPLLPTGPPATTSSVAQHGPHFATRSYSRRQMTQNACVGCRKKRTKCDGRNPCSRCVGRGDRCEYKVKASISKHDLRAEVESLKLERLNNRAVLDALLLDQHEAVVQRLRAGKTVEAIAQSLGAQDTRDAVDGRDSEPEAEEDSKEGMLRYNTAASTLITPPIQGATSALDSVSVLDADRPQIIAEITKKFETGLFDLTKPSTRNDTALPGWLTPAQSPAPGGVPTRPGAARRHSFGAGGPSLRPQALASSIWTKVTPNRGLLKHLIELFFSWEFRPFTMVSQELFLRDYHSGGRQFCSPALVNAIASVATRYLEPNETTSAGDAYLLGEQFFSEAKGLLVLEAQVPNLPSIQSLALLAVREMSCGRELEAQELCLQAVRLLGALDFEDLEGHGNGKRRKYLTVRCITYSGVLALTRAIRLITDQLSPASNYQYAKVPLVSDLVGHDGDFLAIQLHQRKSVKALQSKIGSEEEAPPADQLSSFIFDQTDYVYSFLSRAGKRGGQGAFDQLPSVYQKCLESYETITNFLQKQGDSKPCTLFAHIYFHFCLLALFRPFIHLSVDVAGVLPRTVCAEAVQAVLDVTQSYASLFTLRRTPCFVPYFVFAAGLTRIFLEGDPTLTVGSSPWASSAIGSSPGVGYTDASSTSRRSAPPDDSGDTPMTGADESRASFSPSSTSTNARNAAMTSVSPSATSTSRVSEEDYGLTQAEQQLQEMSVGHPAAAQAGWVLRDFNPHHKG